MATVKRVRRGEYLYRGYRISRDDSGARAWVVNRGVRRLAGADTLREGLRWVDLREFNALNEQRKFNADEAFDLYDMGDMVVKDTSAWQDQFNDEWSMPVFMEGSDGPSMKMTFVVRFEPGLAEVSEAYFAD